MYLRYVLGVLWWCVLLVPVHAEQPPNVILIFADDLGYGDVGCYGATKIQTPNIDRLAAEGRRFTDAHSASAVCTPSRYGLLTGQYPFRANGGKGLWRPTSFKTALLIDPDTLTIADVMKRRGYDTAVFGKWHLGFKKGNNDWQEPLRPGPQDLGFDYYFGMPVVNCAPPYAYVENDHFYGSDPNDPLIDVGRGNDNAHPVSVLPPEAGRRSPNRYKGQQKAHDLFDDYEVGMKLTEKATQWMKSRDGKPFFAYFASTEVHHPFTPAKQFQGTSQAGLYGDFAHELDWIVGEIRKTLEEIGQADNTLIVFTSDNGGMFNVGGIAAAKLGHRINGDLLGSKFGIWEGGHRVPFIAWWPGKIEAGTVSNQMLNMVDLKATFAAVAGDDPLNEQEAADSLNMLPAFVSDPTEPIRTTMVVTPNRPSHMALRHEKWMYIPAKGDGGFSENIAATQLVDTPNSDIENGKVKKDAPSAQLYDLQADVNQRSNVIQSYPKVAERMADMLKTIRPKAPEKKSKRKKAQRKKAKQKI